MSVDEAGDELGIANRRRPEHDALHAGVERRLDRVLVAKPTSKLDRSAERHDVAHRLQVLGPAGERPVEVNDVKEARRLVRPAAGGVERVVVVADLATVVALGEPHDVAAANIDRGVEDHAGTAAQIPAKFASTRRPAALDFSGWNWTP
jgi:hypothetical protein